MPNSGNDLVNSNDGTILGQSTTDKIAFYGATPIAQNIALTAATAGDSLTDVFPLVNNVITFLKTIGLTA